MALEVDHVFICCSPGASEGDALVRLGLREGSPNTHPGQGTANRRFFFGNAYLELLWVSNPAETMSEQTRRTRLWERWSARASGACPFAIVFRPSGAQSVSAPFATWPYRPTYLPSGLAIEFAEGTPLEELELIYFPFAYRSGPPAHEPTDRVFPIHQVCGVTVGLPSGERLSKPSEAVCWLGDLPPCARTCTRTQLHRGAKKIVYDLRPTLPLRFRGLQQDVA